ncbi:SGNH/GDSL hydrolase family protein [Nocardioides sp. SYSU D00038]|uniref:SGNH/GDSL hydrolase family protein n=1 Tax=Nocardioides sp. SYSU D00038 TaxID=2812554 RepID=UPI001967B3F7|nr:SGNH/GDSL hydrolase family protein [Nocardioides sp. SYSU D00038]
MSRTRPVLAGVALAATSALAGAWAGREVLRRQAAAARLAIGKPLGEQALDADRTWKKKYGDPIELLVLGDSIAAGLGAERPEETFGARLAVRLAKRTRRSVRLTGRAVVGAESSVLAAQLDGLPAAYRPDVAVVVVGGNDVTHRVPVAESVRHLTEAVERLRALGAAVVVGTCPDLGALTAVPQPLRALGARASRQLAAAQREAALAAGAHVVSLAHVVGPFFVTNPDEMFALDRFHPSAAGYRRTAKAVLPSVLAALGLSEEVPFGHALPATG